jgi:hypothetical protein
VTHAWHEICRRYMRLGHCCSTSGNSNNGRHICTLPCARNLPPTHAILSLIMKLHTSTWHDLQNPQLKLHTRSFGVYIVLKHILVAIMHATPEQGSPGPGRGPLIIIIIIISKPVVHLLVVVKVVVEVFSSIIILAFACYTVQGSPCPVDLMNYYLYIDTLHSRHGGLSTT